MSGMLDDARLQTLQRLQGRAFNTAFVEAMSHHHCGALVMADEALRRAGDPCIRLLAYAILHEQRGDITLMHGVQGLTAVAWATRAMLAPFRAHVADQAQALHQQQARAG